MKLNKSITFAIVLVVLLIKADIAISACSGSSPTWNCDNTTCPTQTEINACIATAANGDSIYFASGTYTLSSEISWSNKSINLIGAGYSTTMFYVASTVSQSVITSAVTLGNTVNTSYIKGIHFYVNAEIAIQIKGQGWRVSDCKFEHYIRTTLYGVYANGANTGGVQPIGVIYNNVFMDSRPYVAGSSDLQIWANPTNLGTVNSVYVEDNTFDRKASLGGVFIDAGSNGRYVLRYNNLIGNHQIFCHPTSSGRGTRSWEIYGNNATIAESMGMFIRGGTGTIHNNYESGSNSYYIAFDVLRVINDEGGYAGKCDGSNAYGWDGNETGNGYPCRDQIGMGKDSALSSLSAMQPQEKEPAYIWSNRRSNASEVTVGVINDCTAYIQPNRDYYLTDSSFNGTSGVGCGTLGNRPETCTTGVGYWATNQSCSDLTGMVGANPSTPISGTLYKCTSTDTWTSYYTPYTYPHPLRTSSARKQSLSGGTLGGGAMR